MKKTILTIAAVILTLTTAKSQSTTHLQAEYLFNNSINDSHNSNNLTNSSGSQTYGDNRLYQTNSSYQFNGTSELTSPVDLSSLTNKSISLWFITSQPGGLIGHDGTGGNAPILYIGTLGRLRGKFYDGGVGSVSTSTRVLTDSVWHHVVITAGPSGQRVYVDKQLVGTTTTAPSVLALNNTTIGNVIASGWPSAPAPISTNFIGGIDDIKIYDTIISAAFVDTLYNTPTWQAPADLDTVYVNINATGANNGRTWADAYTDARDAFINTTENAEIWIAQGTYIKNSTDRNTVFGWDKDSIRVYGGFIGNETMRNQRDWDANPTIFSGDIGIIGDSTDNAYTVFIGPLGDLNYSLIDGIKITGGNSDGPTYPGLNAVGGGMIVDTEVDLLKLKNVEFYKNYAKEGGAISAYGTSGDDCKIILENVVAHHNTGASSAFGHFRASNVAAIILEMTNCLIYENNSVGTGSDKGTVMFLGGNANAANILDATITNCTFADNNFTMGNASKGMIRLYNSTTAPSILNFKNNICYGNGIAEMTEKNGSNASNPFPNSLLFNNIIENGLDFTATINNNSSTSDPLFNSDYTLQANSPAIDSGTSLGITLPLTDLAGNNRVENGIVDLGAYEFKVVSTASLRDEKIIENLTLYPNPSYNVISLSGINEAVENIEIFNLYGQLVLRTNDYKNIDIHELKAGTYVLNIKTETSYSTLKLIKK